MSKTLDFNSINRPTLELTMSDDARTRIAVSTPNEGLIEELNATLPEMENALKSGNADTIRIIYDLAARLMNCNRNFVKVTAEELRDKYRMDLDSLIIFYQAYIEFVEDIINLKN